MQIEGKINFYTGKAETQECKFAEVNVDIRFLEVQVCRSAELQKCRFAEVQSFVELQNVPLLKCK